MIKAVKVFLLIAGLVFWFFILGPHAISSMSDLNVIGWFLGTAILIYSVAFKYRKEIIKKVKEL